MSILNKESAVPRPERAVEKVRLNLDMHPAVKEQLQSIQERTKADSMSEVLRRALAVYQTILDTQDSGGTVLVKPKMGLVKEVLVL
jgi:hypothetical protein